MRFIAWNVHALTDVKLLQGTHLFETDDRFRGSVVFLSETRRVDTIANRFHGYTVYERPVEGPLQGPCAGRGLLMAVPDSHGYHAQQVENSEGMIGVLLRDATGLPLALLVGVYIPPQGSPQLAGPDPDLDTRFARLRTLLQQHEGVPTLIAGDFNCSQPMHATSEHALAMQALCHARDLSLCTDLPNVDLDFMHDPSACPVPSRFPMGSQLGAPSRIDHFLACQGMLDCALNTCVLPDPLQLSDHRPIYASFALPSHEQPPPSPASPRPACVKWRPGRQDDYVAALQQSRAVLETSVRALLLAGDTTAAVNTIIDTVRSAAASAGMKPVVASRKRWSLPYMDSHLLRMRRDMFDARRRGEHAEFLRLRSLLHREMRCRRRIWLRHRSRKVLGHLKHDPHFVAKQFAGKRRSLPVPLQHPQAWDGFLHNLAAPSAAPSPVVPAVGAVSEQLLQAAACLNVPFTKTEVAIAIKRLHNNKSPGFSGIPSEFFRYAEFQPPPVDGARQPPVNVLVDCLTDLVNAVFTRGVVPSQWDLSLITPVYKRGSEMNTASYRPIAVCEPLAKLYAVLLQLRLDGYLETQGLRSDAQAGFRRNLSTCHQLFLLQHFIDRYAKRQQSLYACYVDLQSAYDFVVRAVLWVCVQRKGVHGAFLHAVQSLYATPRYAMCVAGLVGGSVLSTVGVRQGCPFSPLLFAVLLDDLAAELVRGGLDGLVPCLEPTYAAVPDLPPLRRRPVPCMKYADDILMLALSLRGMQLLLTTLHHFCVSRGMLVSAPKTFLVRLVKGRQLPDESVSESGEPVMLYSHGVVPLTYGGRPLRFEPSGAKYLGLFVAPDRGVRAGITDLLHRGVGAWHAFCRRLPNLQCEPGVELSVRLYLTHVRPVLLYGSELWAVLPGAGAQRDRLEVAHHLHLASLARVPVSASKVALYMALRVLPLLEEAALRAVRFWYRLWGLPPGSFFQHVVFDNWRDACAGGVRNFAWGMRAHLAGLGFVFPADDLSRPPVVSVPDVLQRLLDRRDAAFAQLHHDPVLAPSRHVSLCAYVRYFHILPHEPVVPLYYLPLSLRACATLLRFLLGRSALPLHAGRCVRPRVPRHGRVCPLCDAGVVATEHHMIFVCPGLSSLRADRPALFADFARPALCVVQHFMRHPNRFAVAGFLLHALRAYALAAVAPVAAAD